MGGVRAISKDRTLLPLVDRPLGDAKALSQHAGRFVAGCDLGAHGRCGAAFLCGAISMAWLPDLIAETLSTPAGLLWP